MRVLCVDPALRNTGYAVVEGENRQNHRAVAYGVVRNGPKLPQSGCLVAIRRAVAEIIAEFKPQCAAFESVIFVQSHRTAISLGAARGAAILAAAEAGLQIYEYPPKRVKQATVGRGNAQKDQVAFMIRALLKLTETPPHDAADALAIGLTHLQALEGAKAGGKLGLEI
jgi:crossover junction endodeoxyribonuclease RuvC